ncbi:hypothetical protein KY285_020124 [Solanum tuberosum]|nr:hypothetical protein KY285_020124 [Solanum tuberosum]
MDTLVGCPNIPKGVSVERKEDLSCGHQGTIAKLSTFTISNEQSVNGSLSLCEPIDSLPCFDNVLIESVDKLVDPIDDRIYSSSKIDLCPPSVDTCVLNVSSLSCDNCIDQLACECSALVEGSCNVIKKPQFGDTNENVDHLNKSDTLSISFVADPIACFAHRDHVLENASKTDLCLFEGELACLNSSLVVDQPLFKYNIIFEDDEITPSDVPSSVNLESSVVLNNYTIYSNPLWCEAFNPKDGNLFLEDESTLVGKECDAEEGGVCFSITSSSWCVSIVNGMTHEFESIRSHTHEDTLEEVDLRDTFLHYLFTYDDAHAVEWSVLLGGMSAHLINGVALDPVLWTFYPFDLGGYLRIFELVRVSSLRWYYHDDENNNYCPCPPSVGFIAMTIEDVLLFLEFESPRLIVLRVNLCTTHHAKGISSLLVIFMVLQGLDSRTQFYLLDIREALCLFECGTNENSHMKLFKCIGSFVLPLCQSLLGSQVSNTLMGYKPFVDICDAWLYVKFVHPWHGYEFIIANANPHAMRILFLFASPMVLQGMDSRTNPFQEGENDAIQIASRLSIHELQCFDGVFSRMEAVWHTWMMRTGFHALHRNICTLIELPVGQNHAWVITWSMGSLMKKGGANEYVAPFGELTSTSATRQATLARVLTSPKVPKSYNWKFITR